MAVTWPFPPRAQEKADGSNGLKADVTVDPKDQPPELAKSAEASKKAEGQFEAATETAEKQEESGLADADREAADVAACKDVSAEAGKNELDEVTAMRDRHARPPCATAMRDRRA